MVEFACRMCDRRGRYSTDTLARLYGSSTALPDLPAKVAGNCPKIGALGNDRCDAYMVKGAMQK